MLPVIALVGRPNVGKSTLFNRLTRTRDALVADRPGLTRDRQYGFARHRARSYAVVDTGGLMSEQSGLVDRMTTQTHKALADADAVVLMVDARVGVHPDDQAIAKDLRRWGKPVWLVVNKSEGLTAMSAVAEFFAMGLGQPHALSASHGDGVGTFIEALLASLPAGAAAETAGSAQGVPVAVIGRPNVGKSTLINRLVGEERLVTFNEPGTTRDAVSVPFERDGRRYTLIDTAGLRRRRRVSETVEKFSIVKTLKTIDRAQAVIVVLDAREGITEQDASLAGLALERGRAMVVAVNKWDRLKPEQRDTVRRQLDLKLTFLRFADLHFISALHGSGMGDLLASVDAAHAAAGRELATSVLTGVLGEALERHAPPRVGGRRIRLRFAHQGGRFPPLIVIHGSRTAAVPEVYRRYLINTFREAFALQGTPVRVVFRTGENPYAPKRGKR